MYTISLQQLFGGYSCRIATPVLPSVVEAGEVEVDGAVVVGFGEGVLFMEDAGLVSEAAELGLALLEREQAAGTQT